MKNINMYICLRQVSSSDDHITEVTPRKRMRLEKLNDADISAVSQVYKITDTNSGKVRILEKRILVVEFSFDESFTRVF